MIDIKRVSGTVLGVRVKITKQARRHRIGNARMLFVMDASTPTEGVRPNGDLELSWLGLDDRGIELEIIAAITVDDRTDEPVVLVIHCFPTALKG